MNNHSNPHLKKAQRNEQLSEQDTAFDWKITKLFYAALHYLHALAYFKNQNREPNQKEINIGQTHEEVEKNVNPNAAYPIMPIKRYTWDAYKNLKNYSRSARYDSIMDMEVYETQQFSNYQDALKCYDKFKQYIENSINTK